MGNFSFINSFKTVTAFAFICCLPIFIPLAIGVEGSRALLKFPSLIGSAIISIAKIIHIHGKVQINFAFLSLNRNFETSVSNLLPFGNERKTSFSFAFLSLNRNFAA